MGEIGSADVALLTKTKPEKSCGWRTVSIDVVVQVEGVGQQCVTLLHRQ